jgi:hypothetical protein
MLLKIEGTHSAKAPMMRDMISRFNRDTVWLATGLLGVVIFAAVVLAVQECQPKAPQNERGLSLNVIPAGARSVLAKSFSSTGKMTPEQGSGDDHTFTETALLEAPFKRSPNSRSCSRVYP